ncbi:MAG: hypothetical protein P8Y67_08285 [Alphaproteobacteria bacterium]
MRIVLGVIARQVMVAGCVVASLFFVSISSSAQAGEMKKAAISAVQKINNGMPFLEPDELAWVMKQGVQTLLPDNLKNNEKALIPEATAKAVIENAFISARAITCGYKKLAKINQDKFIKKQKGLKSISKEQRIYVDTLYAFIIKVYVGSMQFDNIKLGNQRCADSGTFLLSIVEGM